MGSSLDSSLGSASAWGLQLGKVTIRSKNKLVYNLLGSTQSVIQSKFFHFFNLHVMNYQVHIYYITRCVLLSRYLLHYLFSRMVIFGCPVWPSSFYLFGHPDLSFKYRPKEIDQLCFCLLDNY